MLRRSLRHAARTQRLVRLADARATVHSPARDDSLLVACVSAAFDTHQQHRSSSLTPPLVAALTLPRGAAVATTAGLIGSRALLFRDVALLAPSLSPALSQSFAFSARGFASATGSGSAPTPTPSPASDPAAKKKIAAARRRRSKIKAQEEKLESALEKGGERRMIRIEKLDEQIPKVSEQAVSLLKRVPRLTLDGAKALVRGVALVFTDPAAVKAWWAKTKEHIKAELKHYWLGTKLLYADVSTSTRILRRLVRGNALSRRERKQLQRTVADLLRLVPFSFFLIVPFMELLLPVALKLFPNMLPSTYKDSFQREEDLKRQLQLRVALAEFLQETVKEVMQDTRDTEGVTEERKATAREVMDFVERAQRGEPLSSEETLKVATLFNDELMLDNISRPQLVAMCRYMGVQHYGNDNLLRFQLRNKVRQLKKDDQDIIWEGLDSLDKEELQMACMERGMRATGLTKAGYVRQMKQWLDLSINKNVPASLLIMSRALNITAMDNPEAALATSMSSMDEEVVTEVALAAASSSKESLEMRELKLESIRYQNEMIADEEKFRTDAKKKADGDAAAIIEAKGKEQTEAAAAAAAASASSPSSSEAAADAGATLAPPEPQTAGEAVKPSPFVETDLADVVPAPGSAAAVAAAAPTKSLEDIVSVEELSALESLAFKSLVEKERQAVDQLKQNKSEMDVEGLLAAGRVGAQSKENKTAGRMMKKLETMLSTLEDELEKVDRDVGDRLYVLDRDSDGVLSAEELRNAVLTILRKANTQEDELVAWTQKCREILEVTGQIPLEAAATEAAPTAEADASATASATAATPAAATLKRTASRKN
ncbi:hypothetical protein PybrP1_005778 [[Pythium] brassicae (nom. inval.)]|nr:hypothetical protein PybrP1_005778 [[Pythium] brassicae (nom. inval.)]